MRILIVGNGGREHALLDRLRKDLPRGDFFVTRANGGMREVTSLPLSPTDVDGLGSWAEGAGIDLVVVGPEVPLSLGLADRLRERGIATFGPTAAAARIESSKAFTKTLLQRKGVPTAAFGTFTEPAAATRWLEAHGAPVVVKASGLAAGKGAVVCTTMDEAREALHAFLSEGTLGDAGREVVLESFLPGEELSVFAMTDGEEVALLLPAQDHKRIGEGDTGPNTGGMGAYTPVAIADPALMDRVREEILLPTLEGLREEGSPFRGLLYAGLMLTPDGPSVIEFNCRFGDPETQVILPLLGGSLLEGMTAIAGDSSLGGWSPVTLPGAAVTTVLASRGYPDAYATGAPITIPSGLSERDDLLLYHAGTERRNGELLTSGGRVLAVTGIGATFDEARERSLEGAEAVDFETKVYRRDIGAREAARRHLAPAPGIRPGPAGDR